jgi:hypothetical protein
MDYAACPLLELVCLGIAAMVQVYAHDAVVEHETEAVVVIQVSVCFLEGAPSAAVV